MPNMALKKEPIKATALHNERQIRRVKSYIQAIIDDAQSALGAVEFGDFEDALRDLEAVKDGAEFAASEIETLPQGVKGPEGLWWLRFFGWVYVSPETVLKGHGEKKR